MPTCVLIKSLSATDPHPDFEILKQGEELTTNEVLRKDTWYE
jgi:hypothetical protein